MNTMGLKKEEGIDFNIKMEESEKMGKIKSSGNWLKNT
jgi:hypothetical protein